MSDEVAACKVLPESDGGLSFLRESTGNGLKFTRKQLQELALYITNYLHQGVAYRAGITALLIGGPKHGEFLEIASENELLQVYIPAPAIFSKEPVDTTLQHETHIYERFPDVQMLYGIRLPFTIYEHTSLNKANAERRAKRLDEKLVTLEAQLPIQKQEIEFAKNAKAAAEKAVGFANDRLGKAQEVVNNSLECHNSAYDERVQLACDHGL